MGLSLAACFASKCWKHSLNWPQRYRIRLYSRNSLSILELPGNSSRRRFLIWTIRLGRNQVTARKLAGAMASSANGKTTPPPVSRNQRNRGDVVMPIWLYEVRPLYAGLLLVVIIETISMIGLFVTRRLIIPRLHYHDGAHDAVSGTVQAIGVFYGITVGLIAVGVWNTYSNAF